MDIPCTEVSRFVCHNSQNAMEGKLIATTDAPRNFLDIIQYNPIDQDESDPSEGISVSADAKPALVVQVGTSSSSENMQEELKFCEDSLEHRSVSTNNEFFGDASGANVDLTGSSLEEEPYSADERNCKICKGKLNSPRILSCLHIFCVSCLSKQLVNEAGDSLKYNCSIECPTCKQETKVGVQGAASLTCDYNSTHVLDLSTIKTDEVFCNSCNNNGKAISHCFTCSNILCSDCNKAHEVMRCFENHDVVIFDDIQNCSGKVFVSKPLYCIMHTNEKVKFYCFECRVLLCDNCVVGGHKQSEHHYDIISNADKLVRTEIETKLKEAEKKAKYCVSIARKLDSSLNELQSQHDAAKALIEKSYQRFLVIVEKCREDSLCELDKLHTERELKIMELLYNFENFYQKVVSACKFINGVLERKNAAEVLCTEQLIKSQLENLTKNVPTADINYTLQYEVNSKVFEQFKNINFGKFRTECTPPSPKETTPPQTLPGVHPLLNLRKVRMTTPQSVGSVADSSGISLPLSIQSFFEDSLLKTGSEFMLPNAFTADSPPTKIISQKNLPLSPNTVEPETSELDKLVSPDVGPYQYIVSMEDALSNQQRTYKQALDKISLKNKFSNTNFSKDELTNSWPFSGQSGIGISDPLDDCVEYPTSVSSMQSSNDANQTRVQLAARTKAAPMNLLIKFGSLGISAGQFSAPHGFCLGNSEDIIVADTNNHRIEVFEKNGIFKFQFGVPGKEEGQLWYPRKVAMLPTNGKVVVCDRGNERSRMQIFSKNGGFIKKISIRYIDIVAGLAVTAKGQIVAVDSVAPTVFVISDDGELIHWFDCGDYMREPSDIAVRGNQYFLCDFKGHSVVVFNQDGTFQKRIGSEKVTCFPNGIDVSGAGDILIGDSHGNRFHIAVYSSDGVLQKEFECPHIKVSRCCGLKITAAGHVVTLAKNNHHVLVLDTLYVQ